MVAHVADFNVIVVQSEFEALVLENSLIKLHKPKYNILLKDDKGYPFVRLDVTQPYPTFSLVNRTEKDGAKYFGPYGGRSMTAEIIDTVCKTLHAPLSARHRPRSPVPELPHGHLRRLLPEGRHARAVPAGHPRGGDDPRRAHGGADR